MRSSSFVFIHEWAGTLGTSVAAHERQPVLSVVGGFAPLDSIKRLNMPPSHLVCLGLFRSLPLLVKAAIFHMTGDSVVDGMKRSRRPCILSFSI